MFQSQLGVSLHPSQQQLPHQYGGGLPTTNTSVVDLTSTADLITRYENVIYPAHTRQVGTLSVTTNLTQKNAWRPPRHLPIRRSDQPLERVLNHQMALVIVAATRQSPNNVILYPTNNRIQNITTTHLRQLLTHGSMTTDSILNTFLEVLSAPYNLKYLNSFFYHILKRDKHWNNLRHWFANSEQGTLSEPSLNSTTILIPCHVQGAHWVALTRRIIENRVIFLYADDLNQADVEKAVRNSIKAYADPSFCPPEATWITCKSITYRPHSNKCGPRTL